MKKTTEGYVNDMLEYIKRIELSTNGINERIFAGNVDLQDMSLRRITVLGEIVKRIPDEYKARYPEVNWKQISGVRDFLSHEYEGVNMQRVWLTIQNDIPIFKKQVLKMLKDGEFEFETD